MYKISYLEEYFLPKCLFVVFYIVLHKSKENAHKIGQLVNTNRKMI